MKVGLDGGPVSGLLKLYDQPLKVLDLALEYGFEGVLLSSRPLLADEGLKQQVIETAARVGLYVELNGSRIDTALSGMGLQALVDLGEGQAAIDLGLALAEQVEVGAVEDQYARDWLAHAALLAPMSLQEFLVWGKDLTGLWYMGRTLRLGRTWGRAFWNS